MVIRKIIQRIKLFDYKSINHLNERLITFFFCAYRLGLKHLIMIATTMRSKVNVCSLLTILNILEVLTLCQIPLDT